MRSRSTYAAAILGVVACASPMEPEEEAEQSGAATAAVTCAGPASKLVRDAGSPTQRFDVIVQPKAVLEIFASTTEGASTITATGPDRKPRSVVSKPVSDGILSFFTVPKLGGLIANADDHPKKYTVRMDRERGARTVFLVRCHALVEAPANTGPEDEAMCRVGRPCKKSTPAGQEDHTCENHVYVNLGDDGPGAGMCG